jgi:hypothetical protein
MSFDLLRIKCANDNPPDGHAMLKMRLRGLFRVMFDNILTGECPEEMMIIAEEEYIRANHIWELMNNNGDGPDAA